jgi:UDP-GlcNAc:undecaprenyl-phosphate GlcNAc-1-phosphate transferase
MIYGVGGYIANLFNLFGLGNVYLRLFGIVFTCSCIIVVTNASNMVDVIDSLIGSLSLITFTAIAILFLISGNTNYLSYPLIWGTATLPYLIFNLGFFKSYNKKNLWAMPIVCLSA